MLCRHCGGREGDRPRGLCWRCYADEAIRENYPVCAKYRPDLVRPGRQTREEEQAALEQTIAEQSANLPEWWGEDARRLNTPQTGPTPTENQS